MTASKQRKHSPREYEIAITGSGGIVSVIAERLGITPHGVRIRLARTPKLQQALLDEREAALDRAEKTVQNAASEGDVSAAKFLLLTLGKSRGFTYRHDVEATVKQTGQVHLYLPDNGRG